MLRVMIVEDELLPRTGIRSLIDWKRHGYEITAECENGQIALDETHKQPPDIIITDIRMPVMGGISLMKQIKKEKLDTKFILLSAYDDFEMVREALRLGAEDYLLKLELSDVILLKALDDARDKLLLERKLANASEMAVHSEEKHISAENDEQLIREKERYYEDRLLELQDTLLHCDMERAQQILVELENAIAQSGTILNQQNYNLCHTIVYQIKKFCRQNNFPEELLFDRRDPYDSLRQIRENAQFCIWILELRQRLHQMWADGDNGSAHIILAAKQYVSNHFAENVTLEDVSAQIGLSPGYFGRMFKAQMGVSFAYYLNEVRIHEAQRLLQCTDKKIYEVAELTGFSSPEYFSRQYKKHLGTPPKYISTHHNAK